jgi:hypothetical protein
MDLFRPKTDHTCHQKPKLSRETVALKYVIYWAHQSVAARAALLALLALDGVGGHAALLKEPGLRGAAQLLVAHATVDLNIKNNCFLIYRIFIRIQ